MKKVFFILVLIVSFMFTEGIWAACTIEKGPPPELVKYINDVKAELAQIRREAGARSQCNGAAGSFSAERRFLEMIDRIDLDGSAADAVTNMPQDIVMDFVYNVTFAVEGKSRGPVTDQGKLFKNIENSSIIPAIESVTTLCALDVPLPSGGTAENRISRILRVHRQLERYFWQATLGDPTLPDGLGNYDTLLKSIQKNYSPEQTSLCKSDYNIEDIGSKIMERIGNMTKNTQSGHKSWEEAIALFQGTNKGSAEYVKLQSRLLQAEMSRQGLSNNARKAILGNLTCPEQKTDPTSSAEERTKANYECQRTLMTGLDTITKPFEVLILKARTTDEYIARAITYSREQNRMSTDMNSFWTNLVKLKSGDEALNDKLMNDLINMHTELIVTTEQLKGDAIPKMIENCRKGNPSVECPRNLD